MYLNMPNYSNSVVYKICCKNVNITEIYVGSTTNKTKRKQKHKGNCNNENCKEYNLPLYQYIRNNGGWNNFDLIVIEEVNCETKQQLQMKERYWLETLKATLNMCVPTTIQELYNQDVVEYKKQYYQQNLEHHTQVNQQFRQDNTEYFKQYNKQYRQDNTEYFRQYDELYRQNNSKKIEERRNEKINCDCGHTYTYGNKSRHFKTQKHLKYYQEKSV